MEVRKINRKHLFWIIPLCLLLGYLSGLYLNIPKHITIDYGENMIEVLDRFDELTDKTIMINNTNCPDCVCNKIGVINE